MKAAIEHAAQPATLAAGVRTRRNVAEGCEAPVQAVARVVGAARRAPQGACGDARAELGGGGGAARAPAGQGQSATDGTIGPSDCFDGPTLQQTSRHPAGQPTGPPTGHTGGRSNTPSAPPNKRRVRGQPQARRPTTRRTDFPKPATSNRPAHQTASQQAAGGQTQEQASHVCLSNQPTNRQTSDTGSPRPPKGLSTG